MKALLSISFLLLYILFACNSKQGISTDTYSNKFNNKLDKIAFMEKYYTPNFDYEDVEYHIIYHDNGTDRGAGGPSDWNMKFAFKLDSALIARLSKQEESKPFDIEHRIGFIPKSAKWNTDGAKIYYKSGDVLIDENKILLREIKSN